MKKFLSFISICGFFAVYCCLTAYASESIIIDHSKASIGLISVQYKNKITKPVKVQIINDDKTYSYTLKNNNTNNFPLQMGIGNYTVMVLENIADIKYRVLEKESFTVNSIDENQLYKNSIQNIDFNSKMKAISDLKNLTVTAKTPQEKLDIIYNYITSNFSYDFDKLNNLPEDYIPVIDEVYLNRKGICYDYSSLFASILRELEMPTKLQMGYSTQVNGYHSWNQVLVDDKWLNIDTTYDSQVRAYKMDCAQIKDSSMFTVVKQY